MTNNISIKSIKELSKMSFFIPSYQRGYRWTSHQTTELLEDIWEFLSKPTKKESEWYCLQPVIVKKNFDNERDNDSFISRLKQLSSSLDAQHALLQTKKLIEEFEIHKKWDVIDGQQRLTTILLILKYLKLDTFEIAYETRKNSAQFLYDITVKSASDSCTNIDFFHIYNSFQSIKKWFDHKNDNEQREFAKIFLDKVKIIWYETQGDPIDIFTRINSGKIPLTNAELIKALFLNSSNFKNLDTERLRLKQLEIASEWDRIEYALQNDVLWYFINKTDNNLPTRIEFIFNLMYDDAVLKDPEIEKKYGKDEHATFHFFNDKFKNNSENEIITNWKEIKNLYQTIQEWYNDRELYHKIGYLITIGKSVLDILKGKNNKTKFEFKNWLNIQIETKLKNVNFKRLEYNGKHVRDVLLLHNIQTMLNNVNESSLFPFDRFKKEHWDVEHIHAIATDVKVKKEEQAEWLKSNFVLVKNKHTDESLNQQISCFKDAIDDASFSNIIAYVLGAEEDNSISNLCLLDRGTNRSYKNDAFKYKRRKIIEREMDGTFIPICTKNIFMKYYSTEVQHLDLWNESDRTFYRNNMETIISKYLPKIAPVENEY